MTLFQFLSKIRAIYSGNFTVMARKFLEGGNKILKYVDRDKLPWRRGKSSIQTQMYKFICIEINNIPSKSSHKNMVINSQSKEVLNAPLL